MPAEMAMCSKKMLVRAAITVGVAGAFSAACSNFYEDAYLRLTDPALASGGSGGTGGTGGTTVPIECVPGVTSGAVDDTCGVFVSAAGNDANPGTKDAPLRTLGAAVAKAGEEGKPVYACTNGFTEALVLDDDATIYGGLDCDADWTYAAQSKTPWTAEPGAVPLRLAAGARAKLYDVAITAADANAPGASSIAVFAEVGTQLDLGRCDVTAGNGAEGAAGEPPVGTGTVGMDGGDGSGSCVNDMGEFGGSGGQLVCDPANVAGGEGGIGTKNMTGGDGSKGQPSGGGGASGLGQGANIDCATDGNGGDGTAGMTGAPGAGAPASLGTLGASGHSGVAGEDGQPGLPGQGGGGGGGGRGCANMKAGPSGGGGGSGGCGGVGGKGGRAGGSSIAVLSLGAKLTFDTVKLTSKNGGKGGAGGAGQPGGNGGNGGAPGAAEAGGNLAAACMGGKGGDGGTGGRGGGGLGGHSLGLAYAGEAPDVSGATITTGTAGNGGDGDGDPGKGAPGVAMQVQKF